MIDYYDRQGNPITLDEWVGGERTQDKRVAYDEIKADGKTFRVSTVWLGLNHQYGDGPPLIFETMVFPADTYDDLAMERYSTEDEAIAGHQAMVDLVKAGAIS